jgi:Flp pilus assembly protein TadB
VSITEAAAPLVAAAAAAAAAQATMPRSKRSSKSSSRPSKEPDEEELAIRQITSRKRSALTAKSLAPFQRSSLQYRVPGLIGALPVHLVAMCPRLATTVLIASKQASPLRAFDLASGACVWQLEGHGIYSSIS